MHCVKTFECILVPPRLFLATRVGWRGIEIDTKQQHRQCLRGCPGIESRGAIPAISTRGGLLVIIAFQSATIILHRPVLVVGLGSAHVDIEDPTIIQCHERERAPTLCIVPLHAELELAIDVRREKSIAVHFLSLCIREELCRKQIRMVIHKIPRAC